MGKQGRPPAQASRLPEERLCSGSLPGPSFTNPWGFTHSQSRALTRHLLSSPDFVESMLSHRKGAAFFPHISQGMLGAYQQLSIDITACANMWGEYWDELFCMVRIWVWARRSKSALGLSRHSCCQVLPAHICHRFCGQG